MRPLLAGTLGVAGLVSCPPCLLAQDRQDLRSTRDIHGEVVVSAARQSDEAITTRVAQAIQDNPYIFSNHVTVTTQNGIVTVEGRVSDLADMFEIVRLARRIAGGGRVVNAIEFVPADSDAD